MPLLLPDPGTRCPEPEIHPDSVASARPLEKGQMNMKYYVQVNRHYMVTVEANSALSAEHIFLDMDGVQYSNAFDAESRKTDTFRGALLDCNTISREELEQISEQYAETMQKADGAEKLLHDAHQHVERLKKQLAEAETFLTAAQENVEAVKQEVFWAKVGIGLEEVPEELRDMVG